METTDPHPRQFQSEYITDMSNTFSLLFLYPRSPKESFTFTIGNEEVNEFSMYDLFLTINEILDAELSYFDCFGNPIKTEVSVDYYRNLQPLYIERIKRKKDENEPGKFPIYVKTLTGKSIKLEVCSSYAIEDIKDFIQEKEGPPHNVQDMFFGGKKVQNEETLESLGIKSEGIIHLMLNLRGGGCTTLFVDLTNEGKAKVQQWDQSAPKWRVVYGGGLCLEGICKNEKCVAYGEWVIVNNGAGVYDVMVDKNENRCPICRKYIEVEKVGFANCSYRYVGTKIEEGKPPQKIVSREIEVGDHYKLFDPEIVGSAEWASLKVITKVIYPGTVEQASSRFRALVGVEDMEDLCNVCSKKVDVSPTTLECGHKYHDECYQAIKGLNINCALCHL